MSLKYKYNRNNSLLGNLCFFNSFLMNFNIEILILKNSNL